MQTLIEVLLPRAVIPLAVRVEHRSKDPMAEVPGAVRLRTRDWVAAGAPAQVDVRDLRTQEIITSMRPREAALWLQQFGFRWVEGSDGIWSREAA
jgi:hypothetical protein